MKQDLEDKIYDYAIRHIRKQKTFCKDATFEQWNESIRVDGIIHLKKATMIDMAMAYIEGEMTYIVYEYFSHKHDATMAKGHNFPFDIYDYGHYISLLEHANPYMHSEVRDLNDLVDYIDEKYSSLLKSIY